MARFKVKVCRGPTCGGERSSASLRDRLEEIIAGANLGEYVELRRFFYEIEDYGAILWLRKGDQERDVNTRRMLKKILHI